MKAARYPVALSVALSTILVVGSALPAFAATPSRSSDQSGASLANASSIQFGLPSSYPVSNVVVVLADLDGGLPDMLYAIGPNVVMRPNLGHLAFGSETSIPLAPSGSVTSFVVADLNGDGRGDLVGLSTASQLLVRMNLGAGVFAAATIYALPAPGNGLVAANLSGDPHPEIAVAHIDSGWVSVWPNHGDGTFGSPAIVSIGAPYPMYPYGTHGLTDIVAGHFDSDRHLDLAVLDQHPRATVSVLINRGDGTFAPSLRSPGLSGSEDHVATGDLNEDGLDDLVIGTQFGRIAVVLNKGGGSFTPADSMTNLYNDGQFIRPAMVDLDGDGHADVVASYELNESSEYGLSYLAVWHGMGNGHFFGELDEKIEYGGGDAVIADLDGDGKQDVVAVTQTWLYGSGVPLPEQTAWVFSGHGTGGLEGYGTFFTTGANCGYYCPRPTWVMARTRSHGRSDLLINQGGQMLLRKNREPGVFDPPVALPFGGLVEARDLNGDGRDDLVLAGTDSVGIALSMGDASWAAPEWYLGAQLVSLADFDGDGRIDLALRNSERRLLYRPGIGSGRFDSMVATSFVFPGNAGDVDLGDTDGDRRADIVLGVSGPDRDSVIVFGLPAGGGVDTLARIELPCVEPGESYSCYAGHPRIASAGSDHPPNLCVLMANVGSSFGYLLSYHRQADGSYVEVSRWPTLREPEPLGIADFDLDGVDDVILTHGEDIEIGTVEVYRGDPSGALEHVFSHETGSYEGVGSAAFMDDDSRPDLVIEHGYPFGRIDFLLNRTIPDDPTPALVSLVSATAEPGVVRLDWFGAGVAGSAARWERRTATGNWGAKGVVDADGAGHFRVEDRDVIAGGRYAYRLVPAAAGADPTPEAWVTVPGGITALLGVRPNPIMRDAAVDFALAAESDVKLDVIDLLGRHVAGATMRFSAGPHTRPVPGLDHLHPGVYLLRFESGGRVESRRFAVVR